MKPLNNFAAWEVLRALWIEGRAMTAKELAAHIFPNPEAHPRSYNASCAQLAYELVRRGYATRTLARRELYEYAITDTGIAAWKEHAGSM